MPPRANKRATGGRLVARWELRSGQGDGQDHGPPKRSYHQLPYLTTVCSSPPICWLASACQISRHELVMSIV